MKWALLSVACVVLSTRAVGAKPTQAIQSAELRATIDTAFPRVLGYTWLANGAILYGQEEVLSEVRINGESRKPTVTFRKAGPDRAGYKLHFPKIKVTMIVEMAVDGNVLNFKIVQIQEEGSFKVKSIEFPNHSLVSVRSTQPKAAVATALITGIWNKIVEEFNPLSEKAVDAEPVEQTYLVVNSGKLAASIDNNVIYYERTRAQTLKEGGYKKCGIWNGVWTYREIDSEIVGLPWSKVIVVADKNGDDLVDWQDGAIGFRENMEEPLGADDIRNSISYISFNGGSVAIAPFLRALEDAKQLNLMLDGFGQMVQLKGYQSEGHDAAHPDCAGNYNNRAGGLKDLQS
ncbi:MAG: O-GlcNAcase NagJ, partial [Verrucomicrobia bacterium]|nr:O-GlcNAcase NagJ [Verrucomicrobiota bacterium]